MNAATDAEAPASSDPRTAGGGIAAVLSDTLAQIHSQGVGLSIRRVVWLSDSHGRAEVLGDCLFVHAPDVETARRLVAHAAVAVAAPTPTAAGPLRSHAATEVEDLVDMRQLKATTIRLLGPGHPLRDALSREPDTLPRAIGLAKLETYLQWILALG